MKRRGYTLIEILAVIVILAIIALITVPLISGVIIKARKASYKDSAYGMIEAAKLFLASNIDSIGEEDEIFFICDGKSCEYNGNKLYFKGPTPLSGTIAITGKGETTLENVYNGAYYANQELNEEVIISEEPADILSRSELTKLIHELEDKIEKLENNEEIKKDVLSAVYPVGSIYITTELDSKEAVANKLGGTWEVYGSGKTIVGVDNSNEMMNISEKTGGNSSVVLTTSNLPSHTHTIDHTHTTASTTISNSGAHTHSTTATSISSGLTAQSAGSHTHRPSNTGYFYVTRGTSTAEITGMYVNSGSQVFGESGSNGGVIRQSSTSSAGSHTHDVTGTIPALNIASSGAHTHTVPSLSTNSISTTSSGSTGSGTSFSVQNPYITVYMWKRIK